MILQISKTIIEFKGGDIAVGVGEKGTVVFQDIENPQEIGTKVENENNIYPVILKFEKSESIEVVIKQLEKAKQILEKGEVK